MLVRSIIRRSFVQPGRWFSGSSDKLPMTIDVDSFTADELALREKELFDRHTRLQKSFDHTLPFFYKVYGTKDKYEEKTSFLSKRLMGYYGVQDTALTQYFLKIFKGTLYATVQRD